MSNVKNFGLIGLGDNVQYGKAGPRLKHTAGTFQFRNAADGGDAALTAAGITSSAGNVSLTSGNVVLSNSGTLVLGDAGSLSRQATGVYQFSGTGAVVVPSGTQAERPGTPAAAMLRFNDDIDQMEYYSGATWVTLATGGATVSSFSGGTTGLTPNTPSTGAITLGGTLNAVNGGTGLSTFASGSVLYASGADTWAAAAPGSTSGVQAWDAGLDNLAALDGTGGILVETAEDTFVQRTLVAPAAGITISNADGVSGNPTFALANDLAALEGLATTGYIVRTGDGTATTRSFSGTAGNIVVTNGDGVASNTSINLDTVTQGTGGSFLKITLDTFGRVTQNDAVVAADITGLVDGIYVNVDGDTMSSGADLTFSGGGEVLGLPSVPSGDTAAASKAYVDAVAAGLSWKQAVRVATVGDIDLASAASGYDGVTLSNGDRVLVKSQTDSEENGIYIFNGTGNALTRSSDMDVASEFAGATVFVQEGTTNADTGWTQTAEVVTLGTDPVTWAQFSGNNAYVGGTGIDITGNSISVNLGAGIGEFNTDNVGIDLFNATTGAIILTEDGTTRSTANSSQLHLLLDGSGALAQGANGLRIDTASVTNAMLVNDSITTNADSGTDGDLALGGTLEIAGTSTQGITTAISGSVFTVSALDASSSQKGVASFATADFTVTSGNVTLNAIDLATGDVTGILPVANGGTGANTLLDTAIVIGNGTSAVEATTALTYNSSTDVMTIGGATGVSITAAGGDVSITALDTNADLVLNPNGTGQVIVGPTGTDGIISSESGQDLTVSGDALNLTASVGAVTVTSTAGDTTMVLAAGTSDKVTVSGPTATQYATGLADEDLVNKYYVDTVAGSATGDVKAVSATFSLAATGTFNIGAALPAGSTILQVKANVTTADTGTGTLSVGKSGSVAAYMTTGENDTQTVGMYIAETMVTEAGSVQVIGTVAGTPAGAGSVTVVVTYQLA